MITSKLTGAFCAAGALLLAGCDMTTAIPSVTRLPNPSVVIQPDRGPRNPGAGFVVTFNADEAVVAPRDRAVLDEAALWLQGRADRCIVVDAHLPASAGMAERRLARDRIQTVAIFVAAKHVPRTRIGQGAMRKDLAKDTVLLREDPTCADDKNNGGWAAAFSGGEPLASFGPSDSLLTTPRGASPGENGAPSRAGSPAYASAVTDASASTASSGGSSYAGGTGNSAGSGSTGSTGSGSDSSAAPQAIGSGSQEPGAVEGGGMDQSPGAGPQDQNGGPGNGISSSTPAADRSDAGRGNGSENGDPGRSGPNNQGGDE